MTEFTLMIDQIPIEKKEHFLLSSCENLFKKDVLTVVSQESLDYYLRKIEGFRPNYYDFTISSIENSVQKLTIKLKNVESGCCCGCSTK